MKGSGFLCVALVCLCIAVFAAGCTSSKTPATTEQTSVPASSGAGSGAGSAAAPVPTPIPCPDKLVWDGAWDSSYLGMAGNHDLSTAWTKYPNRRYGDEAPVKMTQTCWDVEGTVIDKGIKCEATFRGKVVKNTLSGTWSSSTMCATKSEDGRKFSLSMAADNQSWLGDFYSEGQDPSVSPSNWAGRKPLK